MMSERSHHFSLQFIVRVFFVALVLVVRSHVASAAQVETLHISYSALVPSGAPFWIAHELGLFEKEGLLVKLVYINASPLVIASILAGDIQVSLSGVSAIVSAYARGSDLVAIAGAVNKINVSIYALPEIKKPEDLRGKRLGITRFGGLYDFSANYALKKWGLQAAKDVAVIQIGDAPSLMSALVGNSIQAATLQPPSTITAAQRGYRELMDLSKSGFEYQNTVVLSTRSVIRKSPDTFRRFMRAYSTALGIFHQQREPTLKVMAKHLKGIDKFVLEKSYEAYKVWVPEIPYLNHAGMETAIALTPGVEKGKEVKVSDIVDESFVKELEQQGFYRALYKK